MQIIQEEMGIPLLTEKKSRFWLEQFKHLDLGILENREKLIDTFVNSIFLFDDRFLIYYNGREDTETVSYDVVNCLDFEDFGTPVKLINRFIM